MKIITVHVIIDGSDPDEPAEVVGKMIDAIKEFEPVWTYGCADRVEKHPEEGHEPTAWCESEECRNFWASMSDDGLSNPNYDIEYTSWLAQRNQV
jgi:hypothetical protein